MADSGLEHEPVTNDALIRTHLANERTFLASLRTAIVLIGAGIAAAALTQTEGNERVVAVALGSFAVASGCAMVGFAYLDYRGNLDGIDAGNYRPTRALPFIATVLTAVVGVGAIVFAVVEWLAD